MSASKSLDPEQWMPLVPDLNVKQVSFDIIKRGLQEIVSKELLNVTVDVYDEKALNYVAIRMTQRILAHKADETVVTGTEMVPDNWWSHLIVAIVGGISVPKGYGWRWKLIRRAKFRAIITHTTFYRTCPHEHIPDNHHMHLEWMLRVDDDATMGRLQRERP